MAKAHSRAIRDLMADVETQRAKRLELLAERADLRRAPISGSEREGRIDALISFEENKARAAFIPEGLSRQDGADYAVDGNLPALAQVSLIGTLALLGFRERMRAALVKEAMTVASGRSFSAEERRAELARIGHEIEAAERVEEALLRAIEAEGFTVSRRPDARPEIFLLEKI